MSEPLLGVVLAHSELARSLVTAVEAIAGADHGLVPVSNQGCDRAAIVARLDAAIGDRDAIVFSDMPGGSCAFAATAYSRQRPKVRVVTGANLAMLLDFSFHRTLTAAEAARRAVESGRAAVSAVAP